MVRTFWVGLIVCAWIAASPAAAQSRLFSEDTPLRIVITAPFDALVRAAPTTIKPYAATLSVTDGADQVQSFPFELRARGHSRRTLGFCRFPPLELKFDKRTVRGTLFKGQHKLKLTTYCRDRPDYEQRIVLEYLAYRLYNLMTPMSFRVRPAEVTYRNREGETGVTRFGFLIEAIGDVADRNHREVLNGSSHQVAVTRLDEHAAARAALFEFMISNLDWDFLAVEPGVTCCHNTRLLAAPGAIPATATGVAPVPYDFDLSGLVDAVYGIPPPALPVDRVTDRLYRGYCASNGEMPSVIEEYRADRTALMALIDTDPRLTPDFRAKTDHFMDGFFRILDDPAAVQRQILKHCR